MRRSIVGKLPTYYRFRRGRESLQIGYPWLTLGSIACIEYVLRGDWKILELGSGGSTVFFARRVALVTSIETNPAWATKTHEAVLAGRHADVRMICAPFDVVGKHVQQEPDGEYDLLLVDHANPGARRVNRLPLALAALPKLKLGGWLVIDNYTEYGMLDFDFGPWNVWTFDDVKHTGKGTLMCRRKDAP